MLDFLRKLFDTADFPPRWQCGNWSDADGWLHILSDLGVWSAYFAIPCILGYFVLRRQDLPFRGIFLLFAAFILSCGTTHLMEAAIFWWPAYRLAGVIKLATALVSWATIVALLPVIPRVLSMRTPEELERQVAIRTAELMEERERFRTTLSSIGDAVIVTDTVGRVTFVNDIAENLTGWRTEQAVGMPLEKVFRILNEDTRLPVESPAERALKQGAIVGLANHTVLIARDGTVVQIDDSAAPIRDAAGHVAGVVLVFRDVRERRQAEKALRESEARHHQLAELQQAILDNMGEGLYTVDAQGLVTYMNPAAENLFGWKREELMGQRMHDMTHHHHPDGTAFPIEECAGLQVLRQGVALRDHEDDFIRKDGTFFPVRYSSAPLHSAGKTMGVVVVFRDVTEHKRWEQTLKEADRRKDEFLATLAHELRNPLAPIKNAVQLLHFEGMLQPQFQDLRSMIERQVTHMVRLVDDLMDVSRITRGKIELRMDRVDVSALLQSAVETSRPLIEEGRHELTLTPPSRPMHVRGDFTRLSQVIANLLNNAAKFTPEGGRIWLTAEQEDGWAIIRVRDNGVGIAREMLPRLFQMFTQIYANVERAHGGLGIGLTLAKRLVEMHEGTVEARSEGHGLGSEFTVRLPAGAALSEKPAPAAPSSARPAVQARRILVVDDNHDSASSLGMLLQIAGHAVEYAHDGPSALEAARSFRPEVVLLDIGMPGMSGYEVARRMREMPDLKDTLLVAQTGWGQEQDRRLSAEAGFDAHLVKPVELNAIQELLARSK